MIMNKYVYRLHLASLYYNENKGGKCTATREGTERLSIHFLKYKKGGYIVRKIVENTTFGKSTHSASFIMYISKVHMQVMLMTCLLHS